jgi:hypothetical protein
MAESLACHIEGASGLCTWGQGFPKALSKPTKPMDMALGLLERGEDSPVDSTPRAKHTTLPACLGFCLGMGEYYYTARLGNRHF